MVSDRKTRRWPGSRAASAASTWLDRVANGLLDDKFQVCSRGRVRQHAGRLQPPVHVCDGNLVVAGLDMLRPLGGLGGEPVLAERLGSTTGQPGRQGPRAGRKVHVLGPRQPAHDGGIEDVAGDDREAGNGLRDPRRIEDAGAARGQPGGAPCHRVGRKTGMARSGHRQDGFRRGRFRRDRHATQASLPQAVTRAAGLPSAAPAPEPTAPAFLAASA